MNKLTRYNLAEIARTYSSDKHSVVCTAYDVAKLEAINAELLEALEAFVSIDYRSWDADAQTKWEACYAVIAKAKGDEV